MVWCVLCMFAPRPAAVSRSRVLSSGTPTFLRTAVLTMAVQGAAGGERRAGADSAGPPADQTAPGAPGVRAPGVDRPSAEAVASPGVAGTVVLPGPAGSAGGGPGGNPSPSPPTDSTGTGAETHPFVAGPARATRFPHVTQALRTHHAAWGRWVAPPPMTEERLKNISSGKPDVETKVRLGLSLWQRVRGIMEADVKDILSATSSEVTGHILSQYPPAAIVAMEKF